ncbi:Transcription initiation factor IIB [Salix suchowensis]|nr:Transcription initiation factor IIB [Salix suchowensis]
MAIVSGEYTTAHGQAGEGGRHVRPLLGRDTGRQSPPYGGRGLRFELVMGSKETPAEEYGRSGYYICEMRRLISQKRQPQSRIHVASTTPARVAQLQICGEKKTVSSQGLLDSVSSQRHHSLFPHLHDGLFQMSVIVGMRGNHRMGEDASSPSASPAEPLRTFTVCAFVPHRSAREHSPESFPESQLSRNHPQKFPHQARMGSRRSRERGEREPEHRKSRHNWHDCPGMSFASSIIILCCLISTRSISTGNHLVHSSYGRRAFRWGRKAKRVAGACLAIALRETNRPDAIRDVASILEESPVVLTRTFMSVLTLLNHNLSPVDPAMHIPALELRLNSIVRNPEISNIPSTLVKKLPLLILAAEAEMRSSLPNIRELAQSLASTASWQASVVMARYKLLSDLILDCVDKIPWLDKYETVQGRAKVARRIVVARSIKDMIQFYEDIWVQKREELRKNVSIDHDEAICDFDNDATEMSSSSSIYSAQDDVGRAPLGPPRKKRRVDKSLEDAHLFILDPIAHRIPSSLSSVTVPIDGDNDNPRQPAQPVLTCTPPPPIPVPRPHDLLATTRGGESAVDDDELISDNEWEQMLRTDEEMTQLQAIWEQILPSDTDTSKGDRVPSQSRTPDAAGKHKQQGQVPGRINMEAYSRLMQGLGDNDNEQESDSAEEGISYLKKVINGSIVDAFIHGDEEVVVDEWRPLSPGTGLRAEDHYDEYND